MAKGRKVYWITVALYLDPEAEPGDLPQRFADRAREAFDGWPPAGAEVSLGEILGPTET